MSVIDTAEYRTKLEQEKGRLLHAVGFLERENPGSISEELGEVAEGGTDNHLGDTATAMYDRELDEGLEEGARETLAEIDAALQRIEAGTYGVCEVCGKSIGAERLSALPWTRLCIDDQRRASS
ncbi:MAG TPA: TraR/DksA C4-type zinc finger protein [Gaiellaceae bacterium]|nr:TraR/DksA C4-type zinc finger protein [Gaiellaceae bacterium]